MQGVEGPLLIAPVAGVLFALLCLFAAYRAGRRGKLIENIPTSSTAGVFIGLVELKGRVQSVKPLRSFLAGIDCVHYRWTVDEHWSRTVTERYTDSKGRRRTRRRRESGWRTVANGGEMQPFYLQDDDGAVLVRPASATIHPERVFSQTCGRGDPLYYAKGPRQAVADSDHRRRFVEEALPLGQDVYVMGKAREREDIVAPEIAYDAEAPMFLISVRDEAQIRSRYRFAFWAWNTGGLLLGVGGLAIPLFAGLGDRVPSAVVLLVAAAIYGLAAALAWLWMAYNSLVDLRQRVRRAWSHVEVQLKRRNDLIPNLVQVVQGLRGHEASVQVELAELRSQLQATAPGERGPDFHGLGASIRGLGEKYPALKTNEAFVKLHQSLSDTEQRIALARGYFNEIATHFNTRLETVPERFVARLGRMKIQALLAAKDFERAPVKVAVQPSEPVGTSAATT